MASATVSVRSRVPSFACAFLKWLRAVSPPRPSAFAVSSNDVRVCLHTEGAGGLAADLAGSDGAFCV
jgi:hypothetical protein